MKRAGHCIADRKVVGAGIPAGTAGRLQAEGPVARRWGPPTAAAATAIVVAAGTGTRRCLAICLKPAIRSRLPRRWRINLCCLLPLSRVRVVVDRRGAVGGPALPLQRLDFLPPHFRQQLHLQHGRVSVRLESGLLLHWVLHEHVHGGSGAPPAPKSGGTRRHETLIVANRPNRPPQPTNKA